MWFTLLVIGLLCAAVMLFVNQAKFGKRASGARLAKMQQSPHYKNGAFQNLSPTPALTEGVTYWAVLKEFFFGGKLRKIPSGKLPTTKTDLFNLDKSEDVLVWFGHSSYFIQLSGKRILVDPVLCGNASPLAWGTRAFEGTDVYTAEDIPEIDYLLISHDHWDHMDYETVVKLRPKIKKVICGLGTGAHLEYWGYDPASIIEKDWKETVPLDDSFVVHTVPARHFSGRGLKRNPTLWMSYVLESPGFRVFIGGDSGYDTHFAEAGKTFGAFDLAILENGQYDKSWKYIHMMPHEVLQAGRDLNAKAVLPVHSSKFSLGNHAWDEPLKQITLANETIHMPLLTPIIGEKVRLKDPESQYREWWLEVP